VTETTASAQGRELTHPNFFVVARILDTLHRIGEPMRPTQLQQASGMNYTHLERYLAILQKAGLVTVGPAEDGGVRVRLTGKGRSARRILHSGIHTLDQIEIGSCSALGSGGADRPDAPGKQAFPEEAHPERVQRVGRPRKRSDVWSLQVA